MAPHPVAVEFSATTSQEIRMLRAGSQIGDLLREWRAARNKSQLALALEANVSARHVSFIESGRARPSRDMVLQLADALDVPLRERNALLTAAGFAPIFRQTSIDAEEMLPVRRALDWILRQQEPHPAVVMDRHWNILKTNHGAVRLFSRLIDMSAVPQPANVLRLMFDPAGLRPFVANWEEVAASLLVRVGREAVCGAPDATLRKLMDELATFPGMPVRPAPQMVTRPLLPIVPVRFRKDDFAADYFSTVTTLGTPQDVTLQEIRIECFFPAASAVQ
jgi:transcriptional regulator with XRE-family HTH domain